MAEVEHLTEKLSDYETRLATLTKEIERLNNVLKVKVDECNGLQKTLHDFADENKRLKALLEEASLNYQQKYENRIAQLDEEILRLNDVLRRKMGELETWETRYQQIYAEREELMRISHELQRKVQEANDVDQAKLGEYEHTIGKLGKEIERLNNVVQRLSNENGELRVRITQTSEKYSSLRV